MTEVGKFTTQLLTRFERSISLLLDHRLPSYEAGAATLICEQAARRLLRAGCVEEQEWAPATHQAWLDYVNEYGPGALAAKVDKKLNGRRLIKLLDKLSALERAVVLRYYRSGQAKSVICCALELSNYHFDQILARVKNRYAKTTHSATNELTTAVSPSADNLDSYFLNRSADEEARNTEIAILDRPELLREAQITKNLITELHQVHLPRRWRQAGELERGQVKDRFARRNRGLWRFLTRPCLGAAATVLCMIGMFGSWVMWDMHQPNAAMDGTDFLTASAIMVPLRIAQTRGYKPSAYLELPTEVSVVSVSLDIGTPQNTRYRVSLLDAAGEMLWQQLSVTPSSDELLCFVVSSQILASGVHSFLVEPIDEPGHRIQLAFQVATPESV